MSLLLTTLFAAAITQGFYDLDDFGGFNDDYDIGFGDKNLFDTDDDYYGFNYPQKPDCSLVRCARPTCDVSEELYTPKNQCCQACRPSSKKIPERTKYPSRGIPKCGRVSCLRPECKKGQELFTPLNECCPICRDNGRKKDFFNDDVDLLGDNSFKINLFDRKGFGFHGNDDGNGGDNDKYFKKKRPNLVDIIADDGELSMLLEALQVTGLDEALLGKGPFTVFAPTNDAFLKLPPGLLDDLLNDIDALSNILLYHVVGDKVLSNDLEDGLMVNTLQGQSIEFRINGNVYILTTSGGRSTVIDVDILGNNGVIHKIDTVLIPKTDSSNKKEHRDSKKKDNGDNDDDDRKDRKIPNDYYKKTGSSVVDIIADNDDLSILLTALEITDLDLALMEKGPFTVFAPTNDAFEKLPNGLLDALLNDIPALTNILLYHVIGDKILSDDLENGLEVYTLQGQPIKFRINGYGVFILTTSGGRSEIIDVDLKGKNGVVHKINSVLIPLDDSTPKKKYREGKPKKDGMNGDDTNGGDGDSDDNGDGDDNGGGNGDKKKYRPPKTVVDVISNESDLSTLLFALELTGLDEELKTRGPFTVFAPTNDAFDAVDSDVLNALLNDIPALTEVLLYHVIKGRINADDLFDGLKARTLQGQPIEIEINNVGVFILTTTGGKSQIIETDLNAGNGVVHKINMVLIPILQDKKYKRRDDKRYIYPKKYGRRYKDDNDNDDGDNDDDYSPRQRNRDNNIIKSNIFGNDIFNGFSNNLDKINNDLFRRKKPGFY